MSITTLDQLLSGMLPPYSFIKVALGTPVVGSYYDLWLASGQPSAGTAISAILPRGIFYTCSSSQVQGQIPFQNPPDGDTTYLARFVANANTTGTLILADRIWADSLSIISTTSTNVYSGAFSRSAGTGGGDSSGTGIQVAITAYTTLGATASTPKITVINSDGTGDTYTAAMAMPATAAAGTFIPFICTTTRGSKGIQSVSIFHNFATKTSGTWGLVAYRPLVRVGCVAAGIDNAVDAITSGFPKLFPNSVPFLIWQAGTTTVPTITGGIVLAQG